MQTGFRTPGASLRISRTQFEAGFEYARLQELASAACSGIVEFREEIMKLQSSVAGAAHAHTDDPLQSQVGARYSRVRCVAMQPRGWRGDDGLGAHTIASMNNALFCNAESARRTYHDLVNMYAFDIGRAFSEASN